MIAYLITNIVNGKRYVGITSKSTSQRWEDHQRRCANKSNRPTILGNAIAKYGAENFLIEHIASAKTWNDICDVERILIGQHKTFHSDGLGYNMTRGGEGVLGLIVSDDTRGRLSKLSKGRKQSLETCAKRGAALRGKKRTLEQRERISLAVKGSVATKETRKKLSDARLGKPRSPETRAKIVAIMALRKGIRRPPHVIAKMSAALRGKIRRRPAKARAVQQLEMF